MPAMSYHASHASYASRTLEARGCLRSILKFVRLAQ